MAYEGMPSTFEFQMLKRLKDESDVTKTTTINFFRIFFYVVTTIFNVLVFLSTLNEDPYATTLVKSIPKLADHFFSALCLVDKMMSP